MGFSRKGYTRKSINSVMGITRAKHNVSKMAGIPTTKSGRKRKALNTLTNGAYSDYKKTRADVNASADGCMAAFLIIIFLMLFGGYSLIDSILFP